MDSFNTTNQDVLVVGEDEDAFFGKTAATGYSRLYINTNTRDTIPKADALLDSAFFTLDVQGLDGTNLNQAKYFSVHKLQENILDTIYYNFDALQYESEAFASGEVIFGKETDSLVSLNVEDAFAEEIFSQLKEGIVFKDIFSFRDYFPGIAIKGREGDNTSVSVVLGTKTALKVYYHNVGDTTSKVYTISTQSSRNFSGIVNDRTGTPTEVITEASTTYDVGPRVGIKSELGMIIKLDTSPFDEFLDTLSGVTFNQVSFEIGQIEEMAEGEFPISFLTMYFTDESNKFLKNPEGQFYTVQADGQPQVVTQADGTTRPAVQMYAPLPYDAEKKIYKQQIASYFNALFRNNLERKDWLLYGGYAADSKSLAKDPFRKSLRQFVVDKNKIKVKVIYSKTN